MIAKMFADYQQKLL